MAQSVPDPSGRAFTTVPWQQGVRWWGQAWKWMSAPGQAGVWLGIGIAGVLLVSAIDEVVPRIGSVVSSVVGFFLGGGMLTAARKSRSGVIPRFADLFAGFQARPGPLAIAGLMVAVGSTLGFALVFGSIFGAAIGWIAAELGMLDAIVEVLGNGLGAVVAGFGASSLLGLCLALVLLLVVSLAAWLAPALIMLRGLEAIEALRASLAAASANAGALTSYGLVFIGAAIVATLPFLLGWLVLLPLISLSTYAAYLDIFGDDRSPPASLP